MNRKEMNDFDIMKTHQLITIFNLLKYVSIFCLKLCPPFENYNDFVSTVLMSLMLTVESTFQRLQKVPNLRNEKRLVSKFTGALVTFLFCQVAARTLGDLVRKLGERVLPEIIPILEKGLDSNQSDERQGVCIGLSEIISSTSKDQVTCDWL